MPGFHVQFYTFTKRVNSTARPVGVELFPMYGNVREGCSIMNPDIEFVLPGDFQDVGRYNYAYIKLWHRFYYVRDWEWSAGVWIAHMREDVLASWRDEIGESEEYVIRSAQESDGSILDLYYPATATVTKGFQQMATDFAYNFDDGTYVIGTIGGGNNAGQGAVTYYAVSASEMSIFLSTLTTESEWLQLPLEEKTEIFGNIGELVMDTTQLRTLEADLEKGYLNPIQYIRSCKWYPFSVPTKQHVNKIPLGYFSVPVLADVVADEPKVVTFSIPVSKHPKAGTRGSYLNLSPFSRYTLYCGSMGVYPLDSVSLSGVSSLDVTITIDCFTGIATLCVDAPSHTFGFRILQITAPLAVNIEVAQVSRDIIGGLSTGLNSLVSSVGAAITGNIGGSIMNGLTGVASVANELKPQLAISGSNSTIAGFRLPWMLTSEHLDVVDDDREHRGRPLCKIRKISDLGGYMMIADSDVSLPATDDELHEIKSYLEGGFYWQ